MKKYFRKAEYTSLNVSSGVKKQTDSSSQTLYGLVGLKGGGYLFDLMKQASKTKNFEELDNAIREKVAPYLYNNGEGKLIHIAHLVLLRNRDKPKTKLLPPLRGLDDPSELDVEKYVATHYANEKDPSMFREVCWNLDERGAVGETILHLCLLNATAVHADLAKRLLRIYPKLINDIYLADEFYGESVLHIAIVNEDPAMVKFLLDHGADYHERCFGSFMSPEDQKASRSDTLNHEWIIAEPSSNYEGYVYWGEYPLSFAACLGQEECYRLLLAKGADPNKQDTYGNTVLHMLVISDKMAMFDMAYELGSLLTIKNSVELTPLTLAAKLARKDMFYHILKIEREIYWQLGNVTCAAYALPQIDTIDTTTGDIDKNSVLNLVVFGDKDGHLDLMEGIVIDLLNAKWNAFVKFRFYRQFCFFCLHFLASLVCFTLRPGPPKPDSRPKIPQNNPLDTNETVLARLSRSLNISLYDLGNESLVTNQTTEGFFLTTITETTKSETSTMNPTETVTTGFPAVTSGSFLPTRIMQNFTQNIPLKHHDSGPVMTYDSPADWVRLIAEILVLLGTIAYLVQAGKEAWFLGRRMFFENLATAPSRVLFLISCLLVLLMVVLRFTGATEAEDIVAVLVMLSTAPYFLFFCRGFKKVGPFVVMIYRMIMGDLLRFVTIYVVFVMGFSQAYYIIFLSHNPDTNPMPNPIESVMAMFLMSLNNFDSIFDAFSKTEHETEANIMFVLYMAIVAILLINMLIAMMGNTYQKIAETRNEWQRQWARIVLVVERGASPKERLQRQRLYSQPMVDGRRALVLRLQQTDEEKEEMKELTELRKNHLRTVQKRKEAMNNKQSANIHHVTNDKSFA